MTAVPPAGDHDGDPATAVGAEDGPAVADPEPVPGAGRTATGDRPLLVALLVLAGAVYLNSLGNGFAFDDVRYIVEFSGLQRLGALPGILAGAVNPGFYRPLTVATFAVDWAVWNGHPFGFHLVNVLLHVAVVGLVFTVLARMGAGTAAAFAGAAIFAVHPVHVEAVANVAGRAEVLAALFYLVACVVYLGRGRRWLTALAVAVAYFLSLWSKEIGITLPAALLLLEAGRTGLRRLPGAVRERWPVYAAMVPALALYFVLRARSIGDPVGAPTAIPWFWGEPDGAPLWTAIRLFPEYVRLMLFPADLVPDYGPGVLLAEPRWSGARVLLGALTAALAAATALLLWSRARLLSLGILWFGVAVLPVSGLLFPNGFLLAERTLYLPSVGVAFAIATATAFLLASRRPVRRLGLVALAAVGAAGAIRTWVQNPAWDSTASVMQYLAATHPDNYRAQWFLAHEALARGREEEAFQRFRLATRMLRGSPELRTEFAAALLDHGRYIEAAAQFDTARIIQPTAFAAQIQYVNSLIEAGRLDAAVRAGEALVARFPDHEVALHLRARALARAGELDAAENARLRALRHAARESRWAHWVNLAAIQLAAGHDDRAAASLDSARTLAAPGDSVPSPAELARRLREGRTDRIPLW